MIPRYTRNIFTLLTQLRETKQSTDMTLNIPFVKKRTATPRVLLRLVQPYYGMTCIDDYEQQPV